MDVVVGMCTDENVSAETALSLARTWNAHPEFQSRLLIMKGGCADLAGTRNKLARVFLSGEAEWLLTVDTDMVWEPEDWARLRDSALEQSALFVSGTYMVANDPPAPCAVVFLDEGFYSLKITEDTDEMYRVSAVGAGFSLIHRDVFLKSADAGNDHEWYEHGRRAPNGQTLPEDYAFCSRVGEAGIPIYLNTKVRIGHIKPRIIGWKEYVDGNQA
jgi:hypothetical protein